MGSAIQSGIYKSIFSFLFLCLNLTLSARDYYVDLQGDTQYVNISAWYINHFTYTNNEKEYAIFTDDIQCVYRDQSELIYVPYSTQLKDASYLDFFIPSVSSLRTLRTDFYRDEHFNMWNSGLYTLFEVYENDYADKKLITSWSGYENWQGKEKLENKRLFQSEEEEAPIEVPEGFVLIYHDSVGLNKVVTEDMEDDYFRLTISKYSFNRELNDSLFSEDLKVKQKNFIDFFSERIAPLTASQWNDKDRADYYIHALKEEGALIILLNLDMRKIDLYRNAGNTQLADKLEAELKLENQSYAVSFLDKKIFDFCPIYVTEAKNMSAILSGQRYGIFLNTNLEVDSSISLKEDYLLFARKGQVFETQSISTNHWKRQAITSNPVIQEAFVLYDAENIQLMPPFPFYVRIATASYHQNLTNSAAVNLTDYKSVSKYLKKTYALSDLEKNSVEVASSINQNLDSFHRKADTRHQAFRSQLQWNNSRIYDGEWMSAPTMIYQGK